MRLLLIVATAWSLCAGPAFAQVEDPLDPLTAVPSLGATSPLGIGTNGSVGTTGTPDGRHRNQLSRSQSRAHRKRNRHDCNSNQRCHYDQRHGMFDRGDVGLGNVRIDRELRRRRSRSRNARHLPPRQRPRAPRDASTAATTDPTTTPGTSTSSQMSVPSGMSTSSGMLDTSGMSGMCGSGSTSIASSSTPTSTSTMPTTPGGGARTGIPLGSMEIGNLGVSSAPAVPTTGVLPIVGTVGPSSLPPTMPTVSPATTSTSTCTATGGVGSAGVGSAGTIGAGNAGVAGTSTSARLLRQFILCQRQ